MIPAVLVHGAEELFIFGAIILPFWADFDVFQSELRQIKYVFWQILIEKVFGVTPVRGSYNIYAFKSNIVLQNSSKCKIITQNHPNLAFSAHFRYLACNPLQSSELSSQKNYYVIIIVLQSIKSIP